jgi:hypothetical protein
VLRPFILGFGAYPEHWKVATLFRGADGSHNETFPIRGGHLNAVTHMNRHMSSVSFDRARRKMNLWPARYGMACGIMLWQHGMDAVRRPVVDEERETEFRPPYMSFQTFWRFIEELRSKPLPPQIDRSLMATKSGTDQANLNATLAAFGLIGPAGEVRDDLRALIHGDDDGRRHVLERLLRERYAGQLNLSAENGTNQQLHESFRDSFNMTGPETRRKAVTFFLHACREAGIELSPFFPSTRAGSGAPGTPRPRRTQRRRATTAPTADTGALPSASSATTMAANGDRYSVSLTSGGTVEVSVSVNLFALSREDRTFVIDLVDKLKGYGEIAQPTAPKEADSS